MSDPMLSESVLRTMSDGPMADDYIMSRQAVSNEVATLEQQIKQAMIAMGLTWGDLEGFGSAVEGICETMEADQAELEKERQAVAFATTCMGKDQRRVEELEAENEAFHKRGESDRIEMRILWDILKQNEEMEKQALVLIVALTVEGPPPLPDPPEPSSVF